MMVECVLERFEQERVANKSSDPVLSRIAGGTSDEQFLGVAGLGRPARGILAYPPVEVRAEFGRHSRCGDLQPTQEDGHSKPHGLDTWICHRHLNVRTNTERLCKYQVPAHRETCAQLNRQNARRFWTCSRWTDETQHSSEHLKVE